MFIAKNHHFEKFTKKVWLSTPTMHGEELQFITDAYNQNWMSTVGENIDSAETAIADKIGCKYAVALSTGTAALHLACRLAGKKLYGLPRPGQGALAGHKVFCSDLTFCATVNPIVYEGGEPVFIDSEYDSWNMDPEALEQAFALYPDVKLIMFAHLYGTPGKIDAIRRIANAHHALIIEDSAESLGASLRGRQTGTFGDFGCISFNGNKIITGSSGGMFLTDDLADAEKIRKWSTQAREKAPWYQHEELGFNYRMSNVVAGVVRGQIPHLEEHITAKKALYERYRDGFADLPVTMNPFSPDSTPNFWLSCLLINADAMAEQARDERHAVYRPTAGKTSPTEILETLSAHNAEGRPIWKPLSTEPYFRYCDAVDAHGSTRALTNAYLGGARQTVGQDLFNRGLCLPSDNKMTIEEQNRVIAIVRACFD